MRVKDTTLHRLKALSLHRRQGVVIRGFPEPGSRFAANSLRNIGTGGEPDLATLRNTGVKVRSRNQCCIPALLLNFNKDHDECWVDTLPNVVSKEYVMRPLISGNEVRWGREVS